MSKFFKGDITNNVVELNLLDPAAVSNTPTIVTKNTGANVVEQIVGDISSNAFYFDSSVEGLVIGTSCTSIGSLAFYFAGISGDLVIPDSVTSIGDSAFGSFQNNITSLTLGESLLTIGNNSFEFMEGVSGDLIIPDSVTSIDDGAFGGCSFDGILRIENGVTSIGSSVFISTDLTALYTNTPASSWIGNNALGSSSALVNIYTGPNATGYDATWKSDQNTSATVSTWTNYPNIP